MDNTARGFAQKIISELEKIYQALTHAPREQNETGVTPQHTAGNKNDTARRQGTLLPHPHPTPANTQQAQNPWYKSFEGWKTRMEVVAIPFAILYAIVTTYQWRDLRHNFEIDQRAWLKVSYVYPPGIPITGIPVQITNVGKSPALDTFVNVVFEVPDNTKAPSFSYTAPHIQSTSRALLFTNEMDTIPAKPNGGFSSQLSEIQIKDLIEGKLYIAVFGEVTYRDQFGKHWTRFCTWKDHADAAHASVTYTARDCTLYNRAGDGDPPKKR